MLRISVWVGLLGVSTVWAAEERTSVENVPAPEVPRHEVVLSTLGTAFNVSKNAANEKDVNFSASVDYGYLLPRSLLQLSSRISYENESNNGRSETWLRINRNEHLLVI